MTTLQVLLLSISNTICKMESGWMGECKLRQPIVTGFLAGIILGDVTAGLIYGAEFELIWMGQAGIGPVAHLDVITGGTIGTAIAIATGQGVEAGMLFALPVSVMMQFIGAITGSAFSVFNTMCDNAITKHDWKGVHRAFFLCGLAFIAANFVTTFATLSACNAISAAIDFNFPAWVENGLAGTSAVLGSVGFATLLSIMMDTELVPFFMIGFVLAAYKDTPYTMIGVGAIGLALALIMYLILNKCGGGAKAADDEWED